MGTYQAIVGFSQCFECVAGKYNAQTEQSSCLLCEQGKFGEFSAMSACKNCTYASTSIVHGSANVSDCTCNVGFTGLNGTLCSACALGSYKNLSGNFQCALCEVGKYSEVMGSASCSHCQSGTYASTIGQESCSSCPEGKYSNLTGGSECFDCSAGKVSADGASECTTCTAHSDVHNGGNSLTNCTCNLGHTGPNGGPCVACDAGTYKDLNGSAACSLCLPGKFSNETGAVSDTSCDNCQSGSHSSEGSVICSCNKGFTGPDGGPCMICPAGKYKDMNGTMACADCAAGKFLDTTGGNSSEACVKCETGKYVTSTGSNSSTDCKTCPAYASSLAGSSQIKNCSCNKGYTGPDGQACSACVAGSYKNITGSNTCLLCEAGTYSGESGLISSDNCTLCPIGSTSAGAGSNSASNCTCNLGYTLEGSKCVACVTGKFKDTIGAQNCTECPDHLLSPLASTSATNCRCGVGYTGPNGVACTPCAAGTYKDVNGSAPCTLCPGGTYSTATTQVSNATCSLCPAHMSSSSGSSSLGNCSCNIGYTGDGTDNCIECAAGKFKDAVGMLPCSNCPAGKYSNVTAVRTLVDCKDCPSNAVSLAASSTITSCVCKQGFTGPDGTDCVSCIAGKYKSVNGSRACAMCERGTYSSAIAATSISACTFCPAPSFSWYPGSSNLNLCICNAGYSGPNGGSCGLCAQGKYRPSSNSSQACIQCPANSHTHAQNVGMNVAVENCSCNAGYTGQDGTACVACKNGKYKMVTGSAKCSICGAGKFLPHLGSNSETSCKKCPANSNSENGSSLIRNCTCNIGYTGPHGTICSECKAGKFKSTSGSQSCSPCPQHSNSSSGSSRCFCQPGYYGNQGELPCTACAPGKVSNISGSSTCLTCAEGQSNDVSKTVCVDCRPGSYSEGGSSATPKCTLCPRNNFSANFKAASCAQCPREHYTRHSESWTRDTDSNRSIAIYNTSAGATACTKCPVIVEIPHYWRYDAIDKPSVSLCKSNEFKTFCSARKETTDLYIDGKWVHDDQDLPLGCPIDKGLMSSDRGGNTTNRTEELCGGCESVAAAEELAAAVGTAVGAAVGAACAAGGANPAVVDQVQFMAIVGTVGGSQADPSAQAFSSGFGWANFEFGSGEVPEDASQRRQEKRIEKKHTCSQIDDEMLAWFQMLIASGPVSKFFQRQMTCGAILLCLYAVRSFCRRAQMWYWPDEPAPPDMAFPGWEGPVFVAQMFAIADTAAAVGTVECLGFQIFGIVWLLALPVLFVVFATYKVHVLVHTAKTLKFNPSAKHTISSMRSVMKDVPGLSAKMSQCFVFFMDFRFSGGWAKTDDIAKFWGFLMAAYTDKFTLILTWTLLKKIFNAVNKNFFDGKANAVGHIIIYTVEVLLIIVIRPFRDNMVNWSNLVSGLTNLFSILVVAAPILLPEAWIPSWFGPTLMIMVSTVGTMTMALQAVLDPISLAAKTGVNLASQCSAVIGDRSFDIGGVCKSVGSALWTRFQIIFLNRNKAAATRNIAEAKARADREKLGGYHHHILGDAETITHRGQVWKKNATMYNPAYLQRYLVLEKGVLKWYKISDVAVDELDQYDYTQSVVQGTWHIAGNRIEKVDSKSNSLFEMKFGACKGFMLTNSRGATRRFMMKLESSRDVWVQKLDDAITAIHVAHVEAGVLEGDSTSEGIQNVNT